MKDRRTGAAPRGFTLIEMLVVIGTVAILMSLLLPTLRDARERSRRVVCVGNLRQIGLGVNLYKAGFGVFPPQYSPYHDNIYTVYSPTGPTGPGLCVPPRMIDNGHVFYCPSLELGNGSNFWCRYDAQYGFSNWGQVDRITSAYCYRNVQDLRISEAMRSTTAIGADIFFHGWLDYGHYDGFSVLYGDGSVYWFMDVERYVRNTFYSVGPGGGHHVLEPGYEHFESIR